MTDPVGSPDRARAQAGVRPVSIESRRVSEVAESVLVDAWNAAYDGYFVPMRRTAEDLRAHVRVGSIDLRRSIVWLEDDRPVALSLLGVRPAGTPAAAVSSDADGAAGSRGWVGGFGVAPSHRGRGLAGPLIEEQLVVARSTGVRHVVLEVLEQNWARRVYERAGFAITRRLLVLTGTLAPASPGTPGASARPHRDAGPGFAGHAGHAGVAGYAGHAGVAGRPGDRVRVVGRAGRSLPILCRPPRSDGSAAQCVGARGPQRPRRGKRRHARRGDGPPRGSGRAGGRA